MPCAVQTATDINRCNPQNSPRSPFINPHFIDGEIWDSEKWGDMPKMTVRLGGKANIWTWAMGFQSLGLVTTPFSQGKGRQGRVLSSLFSFQRL